MPASRITYTDEDGNRKVYIGDPRHFKQPKKSKKPKEEIAPSEPNIPKPIKRKGGGIALRGGGRAFYKGGKV